MYSALNKFTRIALPVFFIAGGCHAASFPDWGVSMMDIRGVSPNPVMEVSTTNGHEYNQAANKQLDFKIEAKARCESLHHVQYGQLLIYPNGANTISDNYANEVVIAKENLNKKTWANDWTPRTLSFLPNSSLKNHAIQACNTELTKRIGQGGNKAALLKAGFETTMKKTTNQFNFTCAGPSPLARHPRSVENPHPITVKCGTYTPKLANIHVASLPTFKLKGANISMAQTNYQGICPAELAVKANITSNDLGGSFEYRFLEDGKAMGGWKQKAVDKGQVNTLLTHTISITPAKIETPKGPQGFQGNIQNGNQGNAQAIPPMQQVPTRKVSVEVRRDKQSMSDVQIYQATCKTANISVATFNPQPVALPDLTSRAGITIGTKSSPWGGSLSLSKADAVSTDPRSCKFRFRYDVVNIGKADSGNTSHKLSKHMSTLHTANNFAVDKNQSRNVSGHIMLQPGQYELTASLDESKTVTELQETNNIFKVMVSVDDDCGTSLPQRNTLPGTSQSPRPGTAAPALPGTPRSLPADARSPTSR